MTSSPASPAQQYQTPAEHIPETPPNLARQLSVVAEATSLPVLPPPQRHFTSEPPSLLDGRTTGLERGTPPSAVPVRRHSISAITVNEPLLPCAQWSSGISRESSLPILPGHLPTPSPSLEDPSSPNLQPPTVQTVEETTAARLLLQAIPELPCSSTSEQVSLPQEHVLSDHLAEDTFPPDELFASLLGDPKLCSQKQTTQAQDQNDSTQPTDNRLKRKSQNKGDGQRKRRGAQLSQAQIRAARKVREIAADFSKAIRLGGQLATDGACGLGSCATGWRPDRDTLLGLLKEQKAYKDTLSTHSTIASMTYWWCTIGKAHKYGPINAQDSSPYKTELRYRRSGTLMIKILNEVHSRWLPSDPTKEQVKFALNAYKVFAALACKYPSRDSNCTMADTRQSHLHPPTPLFRHGGRIMISPTNRSGKLLDWSHKTLSMTSTKPG